MKNCPNCGLADCKNNPCVIFPEKKFGVDLKIKFDIDFCEDDKTVKLYIKQCEGKHVQQISYSSYHDSLTQVCFGCKMIRTSMKKDDVSLGTDE